MTPRAMTEPLSGNGTLQPDSVIRVRVPFLQFPEPFLQFLESFPGSPQNLFLDFELLPCCQVHALEIPLDGGVDIAPELLPGFRREQSVEDTGKGFVQLPAASGVPTYSMNAR